RAPPEALRPLSLRAAVRGLGGSDQRELPRPRWASDRGPREGAARGSRRATWRLTRDRFRRSARRATAARAARARRSGRARVRVGPALLGTARRALRAPTVGATVPRRSPRARGVPRPARP